MAKILFTGARGFLGSQIANKLVENGEQIEPFDIVDGRNICNMEQVQKAVKGKDAVMHLAAVADLYWAHDNPVKTMEINIKGTWNLAIACAKAGAKLYYASTCCVYGNQKLHPATEETMPNPSEIYACTKLAGENAIMGVHHSFGLAYNMMRFATIYGPWAREALATMVFLKQATTGVPITVHGDGKQTRTLTYVDDLVDSVVALWYSGKTNGIWNLTAEEPVSALQMAKDIREIVGSKSEIVHIAQRQGQTLREEVSAEKMLMKTGWTAKTNWHDGIRKTAEWYQKTKQV